MRAIIRPRLSVVTGFGGTIIPLSCLLAKPSKMCVMSSTLLALAAHTWVRSPKGRPNTDAIILRH